MQKIAPTNANIKYGPHELNALDFWSVDSIKPSPLVTYIHGGGFVDGDKANIDQTVLQKCLASGIACMSVNYRFRENAPIQDILLDGARAIQFIRSEHKRFNIDPHHVTCFGDSAGAGMSLWLATHDDIANPDSNDPVLKESSRISAAGFINGQATYDLTKWDNFMGKAKDQWLLTPDETWAFYHFDNEQELTSPCGQSTLAACDMLGQINKDTPPLFLACRQADTEPQDRNHYLHHPRHVRAIVEQCDKFGVKYQSIMLGDTERGASEVDELVRFLINASSPDI